MHVWLKSFQQHSNQVYKTNSEPIVERLFHGFRRTLLIQKNMLEKNNKEARRSLFAQVRLETHKYLYALYTSI